jgi:hypothetical protein
MVTGKKPDVSHLHRGAHGYGTVLFERYPYRIRNPSNRIRQKGRIRIRYTDISVKVWVEPQACEHLA